MPQVPYSPVPQVAPTEQGAPNVAINTPLAAFGGETAAAVSHLGTALEGSGNELFARAVALKQLANETEAKEADAKYMIGAGELHAQFSALQGQDAVKAYPKYAQDLQDLRQKTRDSLSNDMARRMYDSSSLSTMGRSIFNGAGHAASQNKAWTINTQKAQIDLDAKTVEDNPGDESLFADKLQRVQAGARHLSALQGLGQDSPQEKDLVLKATSKLWAQRITGLAHTAPFEAAKMLDEHRTELTTDDGLKVETTVRSQGRAVGSVNIANEVYAAGRETDTSPGKSLKQMEDEARAKAEQFDPKDPLLATHAISALHGIFNQDKYAQRQIKYDNEQIVADGIRSGVKDEQELRANPKVAAAIDALPKSDQLNIPKRINAYNAAANKVTNEDTYFKLKGLASNDVEAFLNTDVTKEQLSKGDMNKLMDLQTKLKKIPDADPRVGRAVKQLQGARGSELEALGIYKRTEKNKDDYDHFTGALQSALDVWQETHGKPPSYKELTEDIAPEVLKQRTVPGWLWGTNQVPTYNITPPSDWSEKLITDVKSKGGLEPTPEQIQRAYVRTQFMQLYGKKEAK